MSLDISRQNLDFDWKALPHLVSFPRSGSHWLRCVVELAIQRPCLVRAFYYPDKKPWGVHKHVVENPKDMRIIYLYRDSIDVVYSELRYRELPIEENNIKTVLEEHRDHLTKWFITNRDVVKDILFVSYGELKSDPVITLNKVLKFIRQPELAADTVQKIFDQVTKETVSAKTQHDKKVVQLNKEYSVLKESFVKRYKHLFY